MHQQRGNTKNARGSSAGVSWCAQAVVGLMVVTIGARRLPAADEVPAAHGVRSPAVIEQTLARVVKIYGAGGARGLEAYQSGTLISADGKILTAWSYVLDTSEVTVVLADGRKLTGKLLGADPRLELAVLKIDVQDAPYFDVTKAAKAEAGTRIFAASNLYNIATGSEAASLQQGWVSAVTTLAARRGTYQTPYTGAVYVIDAVTNNPGAAGGALVNARGELLGILGKELRNSETNAWLNYALPVVALADSIGDLAAGRGARRRDDAAKRPAQAYRPADLGLTLVPDALEQTPAYIDRVHAGGAAEKAGLRADDLVVMVNDHLASSCRAVTTELSNIDRADAVKLTLLRGQQLVEVTLEAAAGGAK